MCACVCACVPACPADKKVFPSYDVLGWYSTGSDVHPSDMLFHKAVSRNPELRGGGQGGRRRAEGGEREGNGCRPV